MNENETTTGSPAEERETAPVAEPDGIAAAPENEPSPVTEASTAPETERGNETEPDAADALYRQMAEDDLAELKRIDPAADYRHLGEMPGALRFAELRGMGLSVSEAYYAVRGAREEKPSLDRGGRAHLHGSVPGRAAASGIGMTVGEIESARRLFPGLSDREIATLWRRVNEN